MSLAGLSVIWASKQCSCLLNSTKLMWQLSLVFEFSDYLICTGLSYTFNDVHQFASNRLVQCNIRLQLPRPATSRSRLSIVAVGTIWFLHLILWFHHMLPSRMLDCLYSGKARSLVFDQMLRYHDKLQPAIWTAILGSRISQPAHTANVQCSSHSGNLCSI